MENNETNNLNHTENLNNGASESVTNNVEAPVEASAPAEQPATYVGNPFAMNNGATATEASNEALGSATFAENPTFGSSTVDEEMVANGVLMAENEKKARKAGTAAFVLGLISTVFSVICCIGLCMPVSIICSIIALILAGKAKKLSIAHKRTGLALAGFILAIIGLVLAVISMIFWIIYVIYIYNNQAYFEHMLNDELLKYGFEVEFN